MALISGVLSVIVLFQIGKELFDTSTAAGAAALLALSTFHVAYSQRIRVYALALFVSLLAVLSLIRLIKHQSLKNAFLFCVFQTIFLSLHYHSLFLVASLYCYLLLAPSFSVSKRLLAGLIILSALLYLPTAKFLFEQYFYHHTTEWIPKPNIMSVYTVFYHFGGGNETATQLCFGLAVFALVWTIHYRRSTGETRLVATWLFGPLVLAFIASFIGKSVFHERYFLFVLPAFLLLVARGISLLPKRWIQLSLTTALGVMFCLSLLRYYQENRQEVRHRELLHYASEHYEPGDALVHVSRCSYVVSRYYLEPAGRGLFPYTNPAPSDLHAHNFMQNAWKAKKPAKLGRIKGGSSGEND